MGSIDIITPKNSAVRAEAAARPSFAGFASYHFSRPTPRELPAGLITWLHPYPPPVDTPWLHLVAYLVSFPDPSLWERDYGVPGRIITVFPSGYETRLHQLQIPHTCIIYSQVGKAGHEASRNRRYTVQWITQFDAMPPSTTGPP